MKGLLLLQVDLKIMLNLVDNLLNSITMYRLVLYYLIVLLVVALIYSFFGILPFTPVALIASTSILLSVSYATNKIFQKFFSVQTNIESFYITAFILALIITPTISFSGISFLVIAAVLAMASKYILNIRGKHIFNPAAIAVVVTGFAINGYASWWVGTSSMFLWSLAGILIVRKIRRFDLVFYFFITSIVSLLFISYFRGSVNIIQILKNAFFDSPILFFAFVMLSEPLTTPPTAALQSIYGGIVGILFSPIHFGAFFTSPEITLSIGNIFSYLVSPKQKLILTLKEKIKLTESIYDFIFTSNQKLNFKPGQYLEWTFGHKKTDSRGNRRYFTVASSPTENEIRIGVKFELEKSSSYKREMLNMKLGSKIVASQLAGDFTLPSDTKRKLVFIAGGIGVTPYRSIIKYLIDADIKRDIVILYSDKSENMFVYKDVFSKASKKFGIKTIYVATEKQGHVDSNLISQQIPDYKERYYYISGSHGMVTGFEKTLKEMNVPQNQVKVDYFPGF